ncbi:MAG: glycerol kinase GlpK [Verrucomicrobiales bacterium]|nr:glycerol kinase GlpK [Verrucomicrobiota bacterium JB025]
MKPKYILAIDQGTTSSRAIVFDHSGRSVGSAQKEFKQHYPEDGWVEHDPLDIWSSQSSVTAEALSKASIASEDIAAVGVTNQRETTLVWNRRTGQPVYNAIVWQDRRTAPYCRKLIEQGLQPMIMEKTGLRLDPYFSGTKLVWILENVEGAREAAEKGDLVFGTVDSWLIWKLTGGKRHVTDVTNACRTLLFNIHTGEWDQEILDLLNIPRQMLPEVKSCSEVYGHVADNLFPRNAPIAGIAGDQQAALFGQCCFEVGMAKNTYGTGCFLLMNTGEKAIASKHNLLTTIAWKIGDKTEYALEGSIFIGGAVIQWLRDELRIIGSAPECDVAAAKDNGGVYLVPAFAGLGAPHWDPYARGAVLGLTRGANRAHLCRAALESIAFQSADLIRSMKADSGIDLMKLSVDGGVSNSEPMLQFQADLLRVPVIRPEVTETTALGAAFLAGLAVGFWESREEIASCWAVDRTFEATMPEEEVAKLRKGWNRAVDRSKAWIEAE